MRSVSKSLTLIFVVLLLSSLFILSVAPTNVQATSKPSTPQFTIKLVDYSYDVPESSTTTINQYTGEETTNTRPGYRVENKTIEVTIKNQPFKPYTSQNGEHNLYYAVHVKGRFGEDWQVFCKNTVQSEFGYTVLTGHARYDAGSQLDFRAEAIIGYMFDTAAERRSWAVMDIPSSYMFIAEESSGWSNIQTFTMPGGTSSSHSSQTTPITTSDVNQPQLPEQTQPPNFVFPPSFLLWIGTLLFVGIIVAVVLVFLRRHFKPPNYHNSVYNT